MIAQKVPTEGTWLLEGEHHKEKTEYASKGGAYGIGIPALVLAGLAFARTGGLGGIFGGGVDGGVAANEITAKEAYMKECEDAVALTRSIYDTRITDLNEKFALRQNDVTEKFQLYKSTRDADDAINARISSLESQVIADRRVMEATKPLEYALIHNKIEEVATQARFDLAARTCRMIQGQVVLPETPTVTGFPSSTLCTQMMAAAQ